MKVLLRLRGLDRIQHQNLLLATDEDGELYPFVEYKASTFDKNAHNVDLKIETERDLFAFSVDKIPMRREVVDKLWDLLGVFPQSAGLSADSIFELVNQITALCEERVEKIINHFGHGQDGSAWGELSTIQQEQKELRRQITLLTGHK